MKFRLFSLLIMFVAFTAYTGVVVMDHGYTGFLALAAEGGWGAQIFIDLVIALTMFLVWMVPDARERGIPSVPYALAILTTGSIGALAYLIHRTVKEGSAVGRPVSAAT